ncbi:MAG: helicase C-terminal domain-containing protein [Candidatus Kariarchaeaceae archaeon]
MSQIETSPETWETYFPYKPRPLQQSFVKIISKNLDRKCHMVLEAANGAGKTIAVLASLLPYVRANNLRIVYTARTHSQIDRVIEELENISENIPVGGIALRGRESYCLNSMVKKHAKGNQAVHIMCKQLKLAKKCSYYNNMQNEARILPVLRELTSKPAKADLLIEISEAAEICPAETARKLLSKVDVIACSYLYMFDEGIRSSFLDQMGCDLENIVLVIDEAHNLPENVNSISSDSLSSFSFSRAIRESRNNRQDDFEEFMETCVEYLNKKNSQLKINEEIPIDPAIFLEEIELECEIELDEDFFESMIDIGEAIRFKLAKQGKEPRSSLGRVGEFFYQWYESIGRKDFTHSIQKLKFSETRDTFVTLRLDSLDPSTSILPVLRFVDRSISMSGTIGNPDAYKLLTGIDKLESVSNIFPSPYEKGNIQTLIVKDLSTLYKMRSPNMWKSMVKIVAALANETPTNTGIFTPSYVILKELMKNGLEQWIDKPIFQAKSGMSSVENDKIVSKFKHHADQGGAVLCSVLGGRSSEGADFPGDLMQSVVVIGIPYAPPNCRIDAQIEYLESKFPGMGRLLAYEMPAINRASQAAGRPVRGLNDRAFIILLDFRFASKKVTDFLPEWLRSSLKMVDNSPDEVQNEATTFFSLDS